MPLHASVLSYRSEAYAHFHPHLSCTTPNFCTASTHSNGQAKRILGDVNFMRSLEEFDKDNIPENVIKKLKRYIDDPSFTPGEY